MNYRFCSVPVLHIPLTNQNGVMDGLFDLPEIPARSESGTIGKQVNLRSSAIFATYEGFCTYS